MAGASEAAGELFGELATVGARIDELTDLFRRRLSDDRDKRRLIETLMSQVQFAQSGVTQQILLPLVRELLLVADRAHSLDDEHASSVGDELLEALSRYGVEPLVADGDFDPAIHEATRSVPALDDARVGEIAAVERRGFRLGDVVVRVARVSVYIEGESGPARVAGEDPAREPDDAGRW